MDADIKELKRLVQENIELTEETNRSVRKMRRSIWWGRIFVVIWWLAILGLFSAAYLYFLQPYVERLQGLWGQAQGLQEQISGYIEHLRTPGE